jgi:outer membrane protein OmpA-like peptidoglycan-associated protein
MSSLTGSIEELMTPQLIQQLSAKSGVPGAQVKTGMTGAVASILDGLATKAHDPRAMGQVADLVHATPVGAETSFGDESTMQRTSTQLLGVFGGDSGGFVAKLARYTGVGAGAATGFVGAAAAIVIGAFRKLGRARGGLDANSLSSTLIEEQRELHAAVPPGLVDVERPRMPVERARETITPASPRAGAVAEAPKRGSWLVPLLILGGLIALVALWAGRRHNTPGTTNTGGATRPTMSAPAPNFPAGTAQSALLAQLRAPSQSAPWIDLDVRFNPGQPTFQAGAGDQLNDVARALQAYPNTHVQIGGYGDSNLPLTTNQTLAQARADMVRDQLITRGVAASRIESRGFPTETSQVPTRIHVVS